MKATLLLAASIVLAAHAATAARAPDPCGKLSNETREAARSLAACITTGMCDSALQEREFSNNEGILPKSALNQRYMEARVGAARDDSGGVKRLVFLVQGTRGGSSEAVLEKYYTGDHYRSFCRVR